MTRVVYRSEASRRVSSWSRSRRHRAAMLLTTSMAESKPNPTRATLPARNPATSATEHSTEFHPIVRYWSRRPAVTLWARGRETRSSTPAIVSCVHRAELGRRGDREGCLPGKLQDGGPLRYKGGPPMSTSIFLLSKRTAARVTVLVLLVLLSLALGMEGIQPIHSHEDGG